MLHPKARDILWNWAWKLHRRRVLGGLVLRSGEEDAKGDAFQQHDPGDEGRDRRNLAARPDAVAVAAAQHGPRPASGAGRGGDAGELLGARPPGAPAGGAGEGRGGGGAVAGTQGRRGVRRRLPGLEGRREGDRARAGGVWEAYLPHLSQAGMVFPTNSESLFSDHACC